MESFEFQELNSLWEKISPCIDQFVHQAATQRRPNNLELAVGFPFAAPNYRERQKANIDY